MPGNRKAPLFDEYQKEEPMILNVNISEVIRKASQAYQPKQI